MVLLLLALACAAVVANRAATHTHSGLAYFEDDRYDDDYSQEFGGGEYASTPPPAIQPLSLFLAPESCPEPAATAAASPASHQILRV